jgi:hypothetical protein
MIVAIRFVGDQAAKAVSSHMQQAVVDAEDLLGGLALRRL